MAKITLSSPKFASKNSNAVTTNFVDTFDNNKSYSGGTITLTGASYETTTKVLTITATYNRSGFNSQGVYLSLNNDRKSMGNSGNYSSVANGWGQSIGAGEHYAVRETNTNTVHITSSNTSYIAVLRNGGGGSSGNGVTGVTLTVSSVVEPSVINSGSVPIFFRAIYSSGWKAINNTRWLSETTFKRDVSDKITFGTSINTYEIQYDGMGGTTPQTQTKIQDTSITLAGVQTKDPLLNISGVTVSFDGNSGTPAVTSKTNTKDVYYTFKNWVSVYEEAYYEAGASFSGNHNDTMIANYLAESIWYSITLPSATRNNTTLTRTVNYNGNTGTSSLASANSTATRTYTHTGWEDQYGTLKGTSGASYTPTSNHTLYARWSSSDGNYSTLTLPTATKASTTETRTITLNANGGTVNTSTMTSTATRSYTHTGWYTQSSGGILKGKAGAQYTPATTNETLYAQYTSTVGNYSAVTLPTPTRQDYIFKGWATTQNASVANITSPYIPNGNITLYAVWEEDQAKMFIKNNQGVWLKGKTFIKDANGSWRKAKKIYIKQADGTWKLGKNS